MAPFRPTGNQRGTQEVILRTLAQAMEAVAEEQA
jgi:hypothetical protein